MEFSRQEDLGGLPFPPPGDLPDPGLEPGAPAPQAASLLPEPPGKPQHGTAIKMCSWNKTDPNYAAPSHPPF